MKPTSDMRMRWPYPQVMLGCLLAMLCGYGVQAQTADDYESQGQTIDKVVGIVGKKILLHSDIEFQYLQYRNQQQQQLGRDMELSGVGRKVKCQIMDELLKEKMLLTYAGIDSVEVTTDEVDNELERRIRYFVNMIGSREKLEEYYEKTIVEIKDEFREDIRNRLLAERLQAKIIEDVHVTPSDVRTYFNRIPEDSLPYFSAEVEVAHITRKPRSHPIQDSLARTKVADLQERIKGGEDFSTLAIIYSQDPASAQEGGELGFMSREELVPAFRNAAFKLKEGEVSEVVATRYGYHILELIARRGEKVNVRHILIKPTVTRSSMTRAQAFLDSVRTLILKDSLSFAEAAQRFSDDKNTKHNGGRMTNPETGATQMPVDQLDQSVYFAIENLSPGEISKPQAYPTRDGERAFRIIKLISETTPHRANLDEDYEKIKKAALEEKKGETMQRWLDKKLRETYIFVDPDYHDCEMLQAWVKRSASN